MGAGDALVNWPIPRLALLFCTALPLQRWVIGAGVLLIGVGVSLIAGGALMLPVAPPPAVAVFPISLGAMLILLVTVVIPLGWLFRELSLPLPHRFLPRFRRRMLTAAAMLIAAPVAVAAVVVIATSMPAPPPALVVYPLAVLSALFWLVFFAPASLWAAPLFLVAILVGPRLPESVLESVSEVGVIESALQPLPLGAALLVGWVVFSAWYLRAVRVGPFRPPYFFRALVGFEERQQSGTLGGPVSRLTATTVQLLWRARPNRQQVLALIATFVIIMGLVVMYLPRAQVAILLSAMLGAQAGAFGLGRSVASRARTLWLRTGWSRAQLYRTAEVELWLSALPFMFGPLAIVMLGLWLSAGIPWSVLTALWLCGAGTAVLAMYLGLIHTRGFRPFDVVMAAGGIGCVAAIAWLLLTGLRGPTFGPGPLLRIFAILTVLAAICRLMGRWRWANVDFARLRQVRLPRTGMEGLLVGRTVRR